MTLEKVSTRVEPDDVTRVMDTDLSPERIQSFIDMGHLVVQDNLLNRGIGSATLERIELNLSCHYLAAREPTAKKEDVGGDSFTFEGAGDAVGLAETRWGRRAIDLDPTGTLRAMASQQGGGADFGFDVGSA